MKQRTKTSQAHSDCHWESLQPHPALPVFLTRAKEAIQPDLASTPEPFQTLNKYIWADRWMEKYAEPGYLQPVLRGMARQRPRLAALEDSFEDFIDNYDQFNDFFWQFYPVMMNNALRKAL